MFEWLTSFFIKINRNTHPGDIAHAMSLGALLAVLPKNNLLWFALLGFSLFIRMNRLTFFISLILLNFVAPFADVIMERIGYWALTLDFMQPIYIIMDKTPFVGLTRFYNTMVMGGLLFGLLLYIPIYILTRIVVSHVRKNIRLKQAELEDDEQTIADS